jgi:hypothetical protein
VNTICQTNCRWVSIAACLAALFAGEAAHAQEAKRPLLVEHVPLSVLAGPSASTNSVATGGITGSVDGEAATRAMKEPKQELTRGERWEKFETEFGVREKDPSLIKGSIESAKYQLDKTTFALNEFVQNVEDTFSFDYGLRTLGRGDNTNESSRVASSSPIPLWNAIENARFKSDIDLDVPRGRAFVGVRLVLPIGD